MLELKNDWENYGDVNFMEHGGYLVRHNSKYNIYEVISLACHIPDVDIPIEDSCIVARCAVCNINDYLEDSKTLDELNSFFGYEKGYKPSTKEEMFAFAADLISFYGLWEFDPVFPKETGLGPYSLGAPIEKMIVSKKTAEKFINEYINLPNEHKE